jgi:hypothetical protein
MRASLGLRRDKPVAGFAATLAVRMGLVKASVAVHG